MPKELNWNPESRMSFQLPENLWESTPNSSAIYQKWISQQKKLPGYKRSVPNYLLAKLSTLFTSLRAPIRGITLLSLLMWATRSFRTGVLKYTYALQPYIFKTRKEHSQTSHNNIMEKDIKKKTRTYFLYNGSLPDMSDKNMTRLTRIKNVVISSNILLVIAHKNCFIWNNQYHLKI